MRDVMSNLGWIARRARMWWEFDNGVTLGGQTKRRPKLRAEVFYMRLIFSLAVRRKPGHMARLSYLENGRGERIRTSDLLNPMKFHPSFRISSGTARCPVSRMEYPSAPPAMAL